MEAEKDVYGMFSSIASYLGYSELHGRILGYLLMHEESISLQELSKKIGYSTASVSLSLDMLDLLDVVKKIKKPGDRKLYVKLDGDLLETLRSALLLKIKKVIKDSYKKMDNYNEKPVDKLKNEIERLEKYIDKLTRVKIPEK